MIHAPSFKNWTVTAFCYKIQNYTTVTKKDTPLHAILSKKKSRYIYKLFSKHHHTSNNWFTTCVRIRYE